MTIHVTALAGRGGRLMMAMALVLMLGSQTTLADNPTPTPGSLIGDLQSNDAQRRAEAVAGLAALGDPSATLYLFDLLADPDQRVGLYAAQALGALASPENLPVLREGLTHPNPDVRWRSALAMGEMGDQRAVPALSRVLDDPEVLVQRTAAESLVKLGGPRAATALARSLASPTTSVVYAAKNGLTQMGEEAVIPLSISLTLGTDQQRENSATVLGYIGSVRALPALRAAVAGDASEAVRSEAQWAIEQISKKNPGNR